MVRKIAKFITEHGLLPSGCRVAVGLSGGADSVCLARVLLALGYDVVAAHCNFHLRGDESDSDKAFAVAQCERWGIECVTTDFNTMGYATEHGMSIEMAARELRYDFFRQVARERSCEAIAVGHHQDDNIETMLLNLARGTGIKGLCAIQPRSGEVVRPLLCVSRQEIEDYLRSIGQPYVTDHTNLEDTYARNKVRLNIMPELQRINRGAQGNIITTIENLNEVRKVYEAAIAASIASCSARGDDGTLRIDIASLMRQPSPVSVLFEILAPYAFNRSQILDVLRSVGECGRMFHSAKGAALLIDRTCIIMAESPSPQIKKDTPIDDVPEITVNTIDASEVAIIKSPQYAYIDADKVRTTLTVRSPQQGDSFAPFGMKGMRKLLSDFLTDQKVDMFAKMRQLLVCDGDEIVWVVGRRSSELYRITETTKRVIVLSSR